MRIPVPSLRRVAGAVRCRKPAQSNPASCPEGDLSAWYDQIRMLDAEGYPHAFLEIHGMRLSPPAGAQRWSACRCGSCPWSSPMPKEAGDDQRYESTHRYGPSSHCEACRSRWADADGYLLVAEVALGSLATAPATADVCIRGYRGMCSSGWWL